MYYVYILTDKPFGTLYIGMTNNLARRVHEHRNCMLEGFSKRYGLKCLIWYEAYADVRDAIAREKSMKVWKRDWKIDAIKAFNPEWRDLYDDLNK